MNVNIRNFAIISHVDHGKSTLADRFLELTNTVSEREMREQFLDQMDLERERGITIKLQPVRMIYHPHRRLALLANFGSKDLEIKNQIERYVLNLIDTPGHVDFNYEVSRSLAAVEGAVLLVDAVKGIQAQTLGNLYLALEQNLSIIPVINKIDLPNAEIEKTREELVHLLGCEPEEIILASGKTGQGVKEIFDAVIAKIPPPSGSETKLARALIFDSKYDDYKGVVSYVRVVDGCICRGDDITTLATRQKTDVLEVGYFCPKPIAADKLLAGEIGYIVTGLKDIKGCRVGDTVTASRYAEKRGSSRLENRSGINAEIKPLPGYKEVKPMVFAGIFPKEGDDYNRLRESIEKLKLNDAALQFEPEHSRALGFGLRLGLLGLLHLEIVTERLKREHNTEVVITAPSPAYRVYKRDGACLTIKGPLDLPDPSEIDRILEPWTKVDIVTPQKYIGGIMKLMTDLRGEYQNTEYLVSSGKEQTSEAGICAEDFRRVILHYNLPLSSILADFYDKLKSVSSGFASINYEFSEYRPTQVVRLDIFVAGEKVEALSVIVYKDAAYRRARAIVDSLCDVLPRQLFEVKIQGAIGGKIIASNRIPPLRKDVTAKLYGGDVTRKRKLLEKQKKGKKKMMGLGKVNIPPETFRAVLK